MPNIGEFARLGQVSLRMLRHYDDQLEWLHRIVALRDIGFGLEQIRQILTEEVSVEELRGMLRLRRAEIEQSVGEEQERLRRVEAHLRALEWSDTMEFQDVVVKQTQPIRVAQASAGGLTHADIGAAFGRLLPQVVAHLEKPSSAGSTDGGYRLVGDCRELYYEWHDDDPSRNVLELQQPIAR